MAFLILITVQFLGSSHTALSHSSSAGHERFAGHLQKKKSRQALKICKPTNVNFHPSIKTIPRIFTNDTSLCEVLSTT